MSSKLSQDIVRCSCSKSFESLLLTLARAWVLVTPHLPSASDSCVHPLEVETLLRLLGLEGAKVRAAPLGLFTEIADELARIYKCPRHSVEASLGVGFTHFGRLRIVPTPLVAGGLVVLRDRKPLTLFSRELEPDALAAMRSMQNVRDWEFTPEEEPHVRACLEKGILTNPDRAYKLGERVRPQDQRALRCDRTGVCPSCQMRQALKHFSRFVRLARRQMEVAPQSGSIQFKRMSVLDGRLFLKNRGSATVMVRIWGTDDVMVATVSRPGFGAEVSGLRELWTEVFLPPAVVAFTPGGKRWKDVAFQARRAAVVRGRWCNTPKIPRSKWKLLKLIEDAGDMTVGRTIRQTRVRALVRALKRLAEYTGLQSEPEFLAWFEGLDGCSPVYEEMESREGIVLGITALDWDSAMRTGEFGGVVAEIFPEPRDPRVVYRDEYRKLFD
jgi:hypothetical protein